MKRVAKYQDGNLIPGSPDVYDFLVRQGIVDPNTTSKEEVMKLSPEIIKGLVKQSGMVASGTTPGAVTIAQRPLLMAQKTETRTPSFEDVFAAAPDGSIFEFEGKKYKKEYSKNNKIVKRQASKEDIQIQYVVDQLANFQLGGMVNRTGYTPGTETFNNPINVIPGGKITMKQTPMPVLGIGSNGKSILMQPGKDYNFGKVDYVTEIPVMQSGGSVTLTGNEKQDLQNFKEYIKSEEFKQRLLNDSSVKDAASAQKEYIKNVESVNSVEKLPDELLNKVYGKYNQQSKEIALNPDRTPYTFLHELNHKVTNGNNSLYQRSTIEDNIVDPMDVYNQRYSNGNNADEDRRDFLDMMDYLTDPTEVHSRIQETRKYMLDKGYQKKFGENVTEEQLDKILKDYKSGELNNYPTVKELLDVSKSRNSLKNLLNKVADNTSNNTNIYTAQLGGAVPNTAAGKAQELYKNQLANKSLESVFNYTQGIPGLENLFKQDYSKATPMNTPPLALALPALMSLSMSNFSNNNIDLGKQITSARDGQYIQHAGFGDFMGKVWNGVKTVGKYATKAASFIPGPIGMIGGAAHSILYPSGFGPKQEQLGEVNQMQQQQVPGGMMSGGGGGLDFGSITQLLGMLPQIANMQDGGEMQQPKTPIQAESHNGQDEIIILPDGTVAPVNATETHKQMPKNEITDVVEAGSYVASAFPKMAITRKEAEKIPVSFSYDEYEEGEKGDLPELKTLDQYIFKGKERKVTPAKAIERVAKDYSITEDKDDLDSYTDVYLKRANEQNKMNRTEIIQSIITLAEGKKKGKKKESGIAMAQEGYYGTQSANPNGTPIIYNEPLISVQPLRSNNYVPTINPQQLPHQFTGNTATNAYLNPVAPQQSSGSSSGGIGSLISIGGDIYSAIQNAKTAKKVRKELATQYANVQQAYANQAKQLQSSRAAQLVGNLALNTDRIDTVLSDSAYRNINPTAQRNTIDAAGQRLQGSVLSGIRNNPYLDKLGRQALTAQTVNQLYDNAVKGSDAYFNSTFQKDKGIMDTANQNTQFRSQEDMRQQGMQNQQTANTFSTISSSYLDQAGMELARQRELNNIAMMSILGPAGYNQAIAQNVKNIGGEVNAAQNSIINTVKSVI